jgi:hypothetical protein
MEAERERGRKEGRERGRRDGGMEEGRKERRKMDGTGAYHVKQQNKPDSERQISHFLSYEDSRFFFKVERIVFGKKGTSMLRRVAREGNKG